MGKGGERVAEKEKSLRAEIAEGGKAVERGGNDIPRRRDVWREKELDERAEEVKNRTSRARAGREGAGRCGDGGHRCAIPQSHGRRCDEHGDEDLCASSSADTSRGNQREREGRGRRKRMGPKIPAVTWEFSGGVLEKTTSACGGLPYRFSYREDLSEYEEEREGTMAKAVTECPPTGDLTG